jgi:hypothetical protein
MPLCTLPGKTYSTLYIPKARNDLRKYIYEPPEPTFTLLYNLALTMFGKKISIFDMAFRLLTSCSVYDGVMLSVHDERCFIIGMLCCA